MVCNKGLFKSVISFFAFSLMLLARANFAPTSIAKWQANYSKTCKNGYTMDQEASTPEQETSISNTMTNSVHRMHHHFWHGIRNQASQLKQSEWNFLKLVNPDWVMTSKSFLITDLTKRKAAEGSGTNIAGEDFLYMHHQMYAEVENAIISDSNNQSGKCIGPWLELPDPKSSIWPVTLDEGEEANGIKSDRGLEQLNMWLSGFISTTFLKANPLAELGYQLEVTLHNNMHMRFAHWDNDKWPQQRPNFGFEVLKNPNSINLAAFNTPSYDYLGDTYSAHVNPTFFKLHGMVDMLIYAWLDANGYDNIADDCSGIQKCYTWKGTWAGPSGYHAASSDDHVMMAHAGHAGHGDIIQSFSDALREAKAHPEKVIVNDAASPEHDVGNALEARPGDAIDNLVKGLLKKIADRSSMKFGQLTSKTLPADGQPLLSAEDYLTKIQKQNGDLFND